MHFSFAMKLATSFVITGREILPTCGSKKHFVKLPHFIHFYGWKKVGTQPALPQWKDYGPEFTKYAQQRMIKYQNEIPDNLESWLDDNTATLAAEPINRPRNVALAVRLLPLFDKFPEGWSACAFLNEKNRRKPKTFIHI